MAFRVRVRMMSAYSAILMIRPLMPRNLEEQEIQQLKDGFVLTNGVRFVIEKNIEGQILSPPQGFSVL